MTSNVQQNKISKRFSFIWLDTIINNSLENIELQERLRTLVYDLKVFQNNGKCLDYIQSLANNNFVLITNNNLGKKIIPLVHQLKQVYSIYIYGSHRITTSKRWIKKYPKIRSCLVKFDDLIAQIHSYEEPCDPSKPHEPLSIKFCFINNELNNEFIYSQLFYKYFIENKPLSNNKKELISLCKDENELNLIHDFESNYTSHQVLRWYTKEIFFISLLNDAFRTQNIDLLLKFHFFIYDIQRFIEQNRCMKSLCVYKSYLMSNEELELLKNSNGKFLSIDGYFSANFHRQQAIFYFFNIDTTNHREKVLFEISIDPNTDLNKPYSNISLFSSYTNEEKILFTLGSIFRLVDIYQQDDGSMKIWIIRMKLSTDKHKRLKYLFENIKKQSSLQELNILSLGNILRTMNKFDEAEKFYHYLLKELPNNQMDLADCYYGLGLIMDNKGDYQASLKWHKKSIELEEGTRSITDASIGYNYNSIANVYQKQGDSKQALEYYNKMFHIFKEIFGETHLDLAMCLNNIGCIYADEKRYSEALECHHKALAIKNLYLPNDHIDISATHNNLAIVYGYMEEFDLALEHFNLSLNIKLKSIFKNQLDVALTLKNIGLVYEIKGEFSQAKSFYEQAADIRHRILLSEHDEIIQIERDLKRILTKIN